MTTWTSKKPRTSRSLRTLTKSRKPTTLDEAKDANEGAEEHEADHHDGDREEDHTYVTHSEEDHMTHQSDSVMTQDGATREGEHEEHHDD